MMLELQIRICGVLLLGLAMLHLWFPKRFRWTEEFRYVSPLSRQMFYVHTGFIAFIVLLNGLLFLSLAPELVRPSPLGRALMLGICAFWLARLLVQLFVYSPLLWRGRPFETRIHAAMTLLWTYLAVVSVVTLCRTWA